MKKVDMFLYEVSPNETVTIQITPSVNLGNLYTAVLDTTALNKPPDGRYSFKVTKPPGDIHFFAIEFGFVGAPPGAQYRLDINGNSVGNAGPFKVLVGNGPLLDMQFKFEVV